MTMLDTALGLRARGLSVFPLVYGDKRPTRPWLWFQSHHASEHVVREWFAEPHNVAIVCGTISGIVVVDVDSNEAWRWADANLPATPMRTRTAKGQHWFYRHPGTPIPNRAHVGALALDVRGDGGYVVGPGSLHPSGVTYEAIGEWPAVDELPLFDPAWLASDEPALPVYARPVRYITRNGRSHSGRNDLTFL
jgi:putative DNA primase/helicase